MERRALIEAFLAGAPDILLRFGMHEGMRGARWIAVRSDGRVREETMSGAGEWLPAPIDECRALAAALADFEPVAPRDPGHLWSIELVGPEARWEVHTASGSASELSSGCAALLLSEAASGAGNPEGAS